MRHWHERTTDRARGQWRGILIRLGVPEKFLVNKHGPCPICEGRDRFRFDNKQGNGTYFCSQCGAGDGMHFAMKFLGRPFKEVAPLIDNLLGNHKFDPDMPKLDMSEEERLAALKRVAKSTVKVEKGDLVDRYLSMRGVGQPSYPKSLRFADKLPDGSGAVRPAMVATVQSHDGENVTLHRTFLRADGMGKAEMESPRKLMPGSLPAGSAVRLSDFTGGCLGIAEGIETALSATELYEVPCWSAINANNLAQWCPPDGCEEVAIFADNDKKFAGHAAAWTLAHKLACKGLIVTVHIPETIGEDWNDVLLTRQMDSVRQLAEEGTENG